MEPSRRAFLSGRRPPQTPWAIFCTRLLRAKLGRFYDDGEAGGVGRARLVPSGPFDVEIALSLCEDAGVTIALAGVRTRLAVASRSVLTIDPAPLTGLTQVRDGAWHAQAGCRLSALVDVGLMQFADADPAMTFAAWLADTGERWRPGACADSGIVSLAALLADGTDATFGPFGENDTQPLRSAGVQHLVPALFQLSSSAQGVALRAQSRWPARYRLDALAPAAPHGVNLAHLFCGHGGTLGWVSSARLLPCAEISVTEAPVAASLDGGSSFAETSSTESPVADFPAADASVAESPVAETPLAELGDTQADPAQIDRQIKVLFDPAGRFPAFPLSADPA